MKTKQAKKSQSNEVIESFMLLCCLLCLLLFDQNTSSKPPPSDVQLTQQSATTPSNLDVNAEDKKNSPPDATHLPTSASPSSSSSSSPRAEFSPTAAATAETSATVPSPTNDSSHHAAANKLLTRRASNSQLEAKLHPSNGMPAPIETSRKVSRPSTPISRNDAAPAPSLTTISPTHAHAQLTSHSSNPNPPTGWAVAPNNPAYDTTATSPSSLATGSTSARATRRRSAEQLSTLIPETIQEKIRNKHAPAPAQESISTTTANSRRATAIAGLDLSAVVAAADASSHAGHTGTSRSRRSSGTFERMVTINKIALPKSDETNSSVDSSPNGLDLSHREGRRKFGAKGSNFNARYELTDAQEAELKRNPYLWMDQHIWRYHINAVFSFYSTLPITSTVPTISGLQVTTAAPSSQFPSIHQHDRIVYSQLQHIARDSVHRIYLLLRKELKSDKPGLDEKELEKKIWKRLEELLPGHGNEQQTLQFCSLYLLDALAKTQAGSVGRREFILLFPQTHLRMFGDPKDVNKAERKKLIMECYKLNLAKLMEPFPIAPSKSAADPISPIDESPTSPASQVYSLADDGAHYQPPIRLVSRGDRHRSMAGPMPATTMAQLVDAPSAVRPDASRRRSLAGPLPSAVMSVSSPTAHKADESDHSPLARDHMRSSLERRRTFRHVVDVESYRSVSRVASFDANSVDRLLRELQGDTATVAAGGAMNRSRRESKINQEEKSNQTTTTMAASTPTNIESRRGSYRNTRSRPASP